MINKELIQIDPYAIDQNLLRYIELDKLVFLFLNEALPLVRMTLLGDPFEGSLPPILAALLREQGRRLMTDKKTGAPLYPIEYLENPKQYLEKARAREIKERGNHFLSCWHADDHESEAMWRLYANYNKGMAIQSDIRTLAQALPSEYNNKGFSTPIAISSVEYIDFRDPPERLLRSNNRRLELLKRIAFEHEKEVRIHTRLSCGYGVSPEKVQPEVERDYILLSTPIDKIIKKIIIAPGAPSYLYELVLSLVEHFKYSIPVERSRLADMPIHVHWAHEHDLHLFYPPNSADDESESSG
jgi:Protein of unknown function (DUF2971)